MADANRVPVTTRLKPDDKALLATAAAGAGLDPGVVYLKEKRELLEVLRDASLPALWIEAHVLAREPRNA